MTKRPEYTPVTVPLAQQTGAAPAETEILSRWRWVKPCAWTVRMLTALEQGVKGEKWFRLFDKVFSERNLWTAFQQVAAKKGAAGVDHVTIQQFERQIPEPIWELSDALKNRTYQPQATDEFISQSLDRTKLDRWEFPQYETVSSKRRL